MDDELDQEELRGPRRWLGRARRRWVETYERSALLRHLVHEPLFLAALLALVFSVLGVSLVLPKVWDSAPAGFSKSVRISLLDYVQAWALRRAARKAETLGDFDRALIAWRAAIANNVASPESHRGALGLLRTAPWVHSSNVGLLFLSSEFLLELSGTNRADVLLVADVMERHRAPDVALEMLQRWEGQRTPEEDIVYARALVASGRFGALAAWRRGRAAAVPSDPVLDLYLAAVDSIGPPERAVPALARLRATLEGPRYRLEAARMLCLASGIRNELAEYERGLGVLRELNSAMAMDDAAWWDLLARNGRADEARKLAENYERVPPPTPLEVVQLAQAWSNLGLEDKALNMLAENAEQYGLVPDVWGAYLDLLVRRRDWNEVRRVAANLQAHAASRDDVLPVAWYAEAISDLVQDRRTSARESLQRLRSGRLPNARLSLRMATSLNRVGEFETAGSILGRIRAELGDLPEYWLQVIGSAQGLKDLEGLRRGTDGLLECAPDSELGLALRIALLLVTRESPAEALALSVRLVSSGADTPVVRINHAAALLQNGRAAEAAEVLDSVDPAVLPPNERTAWLMASAEALAQQGRPREAYDLGVKADLALALPIEAEWFRGFLEDCRRQGAEHRP